MPVKKEKFEGPRQPPEWWAVRIRLETEMLGSVPLNVKIYKDYVASKAPPEAHADGTIDAEIAALDAYEQLDLRGRTGFFREHETNLPMIKQHVIKGYFKEVCGALREVKGSHSSKLVAYKTKIDNLLFVRPRFMRLYIPAGTGEDVLERPLRAQTMMGPRTALVASEQLPIGTYFDTKLKVIAPDVITEALLREWLEYGEDKGLGQWRSGGYGSFVYTMKAFTPKEVQAQVALELAALGNGNGYHELEAA